MIARPYYMDWLGRWRDKDVIKVVTGMRRCGKSTLLALYRERLVAQGVRATNIIDINFERLDADYPLSAKPLYDYVVARLSPGMNYVFLDEVQHVEGFERAVDGLFVRDDVDLYITGSNAFLLSGELATLLSGRYVELMCMPLSFAEYSSAFPGENPDALFNHYLMYGGLPYTLQIDDEADIADYLGGVFNTVVIKDIAARHPKMDMPAFTNTTRFLADNIGNISSLRSISKGLAAGGRKVSVATVGGYVGALEQSHLLFKARRFDVRGRQHLNTLEKYYLGDLGLRLCILGSGQGDLGRRLENAVYLELRRRYAEVSVGVLRAGEVDFVAVDVSGMPHYFQVSLSVLDEATLARELAPLKAIPDNYPKTLLTLDRVGVGDREGIAQENVVDWMLA